ncbi:MAG: ATP-dependent DNA helicase [Lachnospiraceae bacterium]|nr:ATP-dependent DNA helicase [Lachnospiraceae bacterium]
MQEGSRLHRMIQGGAGENYASEVLLKYQYVTERYTIKIEGRADGIIFEGRRRIDGELQSQLPAVNPQWTEDEEYDQITIDEIKCVAKKLEYMKAPVPVHLAQAKVYAYIYALQKQLPMIRVRMSYCHFETEEIRYFFEEYTFSALETWFEDLMREYKKWADFQLEWEDIYKSSVRAAEFPFPYREGQRELVVSVYQTIKESKKLYIEAPTGVGKTISTIFPALKAAGEGMAGKIFYLTAKTITRTVAEDTFELLRGRGLQCKTVTLTAKEKICPMEEVECNPLACPYAKGHFDRINDALYDIITHEDRFSRTVIMEYAVKHQVCPFEFSLDISLFADGVICDYNYVFDPHASLKRFFSEGMKGDYIFLIDEAHNLVERGREMYSASICKEDILALRKQIKDVMSISGQKVSSKKSVIRQESLFSEKEFQKGITEDISRQGFTKNLPLNRIAKSLDHLNKYLLELKRECENYIELEDVSDLIRITERLYTTIGSYLEEEDERPVRKAILELYFEVGHFLMIYEKMDENYRPYCELREDGHFVVKLFCVNPREKLKECMIKGRSSILFSATLLPIQYYKKLLGGEPEDYEIYARSTFDRRRMGLFIAKDATSKYTRRNDMEYHKIAAYIYEIFRAKPGNYMVFLPSHVFLEHVYDIFCRSFYEEGSMECIVQHERMDEQMREEFLRKFSDEGEAEKEWKDDGDVSTEGRAGMGQPTALAGKEIFLQKKEGRKKGLIGFCVLGGIFSEGIDLRQDSLIGSIVIGPGLPQVCNEREILKDFFDDEEHDGYDYAYRFPGMNKILQAAGRVIRTAEDVGVVVLLEERLLNRSYQRIFPREWSDYETTTNTAVADKLVSFWKKWK